MAPELAKLGVDIVALSKDTPQDAKYHRERDGLSLRLLADPELDVIRDYGLEHHKAIEFSTGKFTILGVPLALVPSVKTMAIPTTMIVDEGGVIRWIDQAEDYRLRSDEERVLTEVRRQFSEAHDRA